jgi:hypothetical protein
MEEVIVAENTVNITNTAIESLARCLFPTILKYFKSDEGKREFEEWRAEQIKKAA